MAVLPLDTILPGDCVDILNGLPEKSVDLIFADPPYNLQLRGELWRPNMTHVDAVDDDWDRFEDFAAYDVFTRAWLAACRRVLKETGTLWVIGTYHNIHRVGAAMQDLGYWILNEVTWIKCLSGDTCVFVKNRQNRVSYRTLADLSNKPSEPLDILTPQGWKKLIAVAHSTKPKSKVKIQAGYVTEFTASPEHLIPIWRYNYGQRFKEKTAFNIAQEITQTYLMQMDIAPHLPGCYSEVDMIQLLEDSDIPIFVRGGYSLYKQLNPYGKWWNTLVARYDYPDLHWYLAKDWLPVSIARLEGIPIENITSGYSKNAEAFPSTLKLNSDWGFLIGLYLAEGNINKQTQVRFSLHKKEDYFVERLHSLLEPYNIPIFRHYCGKNGMAVYFGSRIVCAFIRHFVEGKNAKTKSLVIDRVLNTPTSFRKGILDGFLAGDGYYEKKNERYTVGCASPALIQSVQLLALSLGYYATIGQTQVTLKVTGKDYPVYNLKIYNREHHSAGEMEFQIVRAKAKVENEVSTDWYDLVVEDGLFAINAGIVVHNSNPMPQFRGVRFANAHETLLWAKKSPEARYTFNYHAMKTLNGGKQMRSDWVIPICSGAERIRVNGEKAHSTQKPEALLYRVILASSNPGDVVLDPFFGSGTSGAVAKKLQRHYIGIERDPFYIQVAQDRLQQTQPEPLPDFPNGKRNAPRIPFTRILERGWLVPGQRLYFRQDRTIAAEITPAGKLRREDYEGSIHAVGRFLLGGSPCNGWEHWYYEDEAGQLQPLDVLRERMRTTQKILNE